jgi:hypothetical protein
VQLAKGLFLPLIIACAPLSAGDLSSTTVAKFLRVILQGAGVKGVACADKEVQAELAGLGVPVDPDSKVVWVDSDKDIALLARLGKCVICGTRSGARAGAALALLSEDGRPVILVNPKALAASHLTLPDSVLKLAKVSL